MLRTLRMRRREPWRRLKRRDGVFDEAIAVNVQDVRIDQRNLISNRTTLQDILREMLSGVRKTQERQHGMLETLTTVLEGQGGRIRDDMAAGNSVGRF